MCAATGEEKAQFDLNYLTILQAHSESTFEVQTMLVISIIRQCLCAEIS